MKKLSLVLITCLIACTSMHKQHLGGIAPDVEIDYAPPVPSEFVLSNGIKVFYIQDDEVPLVSGKLYIPGGYLHWSQFPVGVTEALGSQMRLGGAGDLGPSELDTRLKELSAGISSSIGKEFTSFAFSGLSADVDELLELFYDMIRKPRFDQQRLELWRRQGVEGIARRGDDPATIARLTLRKALVGDSRTFGRTLRKKHVTAVSRVALLQAHRKIVFPDNALMAVKGSLSLEAVKEKLDRVLGAWEKRGGNLPEAGRFTHLSAPGIYFVSKQLQQSTVYIGQTGPERLPPDYAAIDVFNEVFGTSSFNCLLMQELREKRGLVYGVWGGINPDVGVGINVIAFQTKTDSTTEAISESIHVLERMQKGDFPEKKVREAKASIKNSFVFRYDSTKELVKRVAARTLLDFPDDFDETYLPLISEVSKEAVQEVASKYWNIDDLALVVVGDPALYAELERLLADNSSPLFGKTLHKIDFDEVPKFN